ncbi:MAG: ABC transporter ATP-binding protein [Spirochaetales bacterium]|nr:ABC transporter ATP-binding protein [Spirochaetales bacterium]
MRSGTVFNSLLEVRELSWAYKRDFALNNISFSLYPANRIGIIGPNGAGKSTLIKVLLKIHKPPLNSIFIKGTDICGLTQSRLAGYLSYVPQIAADPGHFSVKEIVQMGRYVYGHCDSSEDKQIVESALGALELSLLQNRNIAELSGGEFQRVLLARALAQKTEILLLDEPTNHLDMVQQLRILRTLKKEQQKRGFSILSVFHDINLALDFCTHILVMKQGQLISFSESKDLFESEILDDVYQLKFTRVKDRGSHSQYLIASLR